MKTFAIIFILAASTAFSQSTTFEDSLLDRLAGDWVMRGTIMGKPTTHDVTADWVLAHQYMQIHEISREDKAGTEGKYEATVFIGWDAPTKQYACLWLDVTGGGGLTGDAIGHAQRQDETIPFVFKGSDGTLFHNTFVYDRKADSWQWIMDGEEKGNFNRSRGSH